MLEFRLLGPFEVFVAGRPVPLPAEKPRALLAVLLLSRNRAVPVGELVSELWGDEPPETAGKALQVYVSQLRKALGPDRVVTKPPGYSLHVKQGELDLDLFERLAREGRERLSAGDAKAAAKRLEQALDLWRGPALAEFRSELYLQHAGARLEESRLAAVEQRIDADLALGRHAALVAELEELVALHPLRERLRGQLMLVYYRAGRQADALELYRRTRETLVEELGIEPGPDLQELERAILRHDRGLQPGRQPGPPPPARDEPHPAPSRRRPLLIGVVVLAVVTAAAVAAALALTGGGSSARSSRELPAFVDKLENFLGQSRDGRRAVAAAVGAAFDCKLPPRAAVVRLNSVQRNRQSLLQQVAALAVPDDREALRASDLFQKATHASISADWHYRDWLRAHTGCPRGNGSTELRAARVADKRATSLKRAFLAVFDPLARRFRKRAWTADEF